MVGCDMILSERVRCVVSDNAKKRVGREHSMLLPFLTSSVGNTVGSDEGNLLGFKVVGCNMIWREIISNNSKIHSQNELLLLSFLTSSVGDMVGLAEGDLLGLKVVGCSNMIYRVR